MRVFTKLKSLSSLSIIAVLFLAFGLGLAIVSSQQQQDQRSRAAEETSATTVLANSETGFSGTQGKNGWYYGYSEGAFTGSNFREMEQFSSDVWFVKSSSYWTQISSEALHPNAVATSDGKQPVEQWAIRRWVSTYEGEVTVEGSVWDELPVAPSTGANGIGISIQVDGTERYKRSITEGDSTHHQFKFKANVEVGTTIDFVVSPGANDWTDVLAMEAKISHQGDTTPPSTPTNLTATAVSSTQIDLSWTASTDNVAVTCYKIFRDGAEVATVTTITHQDTGLTPDTTYKYQVSACDAAGNNSGKSNEAQAKTLPGSAGTTTLNFNMLLHGIGVAGDNANPQGGTQDPIHDQWPIIIQLENNTGNVWMLNGTANFQQQTGNFTATVTFDNNTTGFNNFSGGTYGVRVKFPQSLNTPIQPFQNITLGEVNTFPQFVLETGDIDNDGFRKVTDYNILIGCIHDANNPNECPTQYKEFADLDDNGVIDGFDYTLFIREMTVDQ